MKINKKLLPLKAQFFFIYAGAAPIIPFIPIIVKELGFSSVTIGWVFSVCPVLTIIMKPIIGSLSDKYKIHKAFVLILLFIHTVATYSAKWVPPLPTANPITLDCDKELVVKTCSDKLLEECYSSNILEVFNTTSTCKIRLENKVHSFEDFSVILHHASVQGNCLSIYLRNESYLYSMWSSACTAKATAAELFCDNAILKELLTIPDVDDNDVAFTYQFWVLVTVIICISVSMSIAMSLVDTICFEFLGDKPENYGKQRMWGAIGWGILSTISGFIVDFMSKGKDRKDYSISFDIMLVFSIIHFFIIVSMKVNQNEESKNIIMDVKNLFKSPKICVFVVWCIISGINASFIWNFLFWFIEDLASRNGCTHSSYIQTLEGFVLTVHTYCGDIPFLFLSGRILKTIGHVNAMTLVLFTFGVRFLIYSALTNPLWILPVECLNGITFGLFYATMTTYSSVIAPPGTEATVQNLMTAIFEGIGTSLGGLLGGYLFKVLGSSKTFLIMGSSAMIFAFIHIIVQKFTKNVQPDIYKTGDVSANDNLEKEGELTVYYDKDDRPLEN